MALRNAEKAAVRPDDSGMMLIVDDGGGKTVVTGSGTVQEEA